MNRIPTLGRVLLVLAVVGALLLFSLWERSEDTTFPAQPPIIEAHAHAHLGWSGLWGGWFQDVFLSLTSKDYLPQVIDMRVFGGVEPLKDPESRFGKAISTSTDQDGMRWSRYSTPFGYAEVGCEKRHSAATAEAIANAPCFPVVYAYTDASLDQVFREPLLRQIRFAQDWKSHATWRNFAVKGATAISSSISPSEANV